MKFLQFYNIYEQCLDKFYAERPGLELRPAMEQMEAIREFGFSSGYAYAPYMAAQGYEPTFIIPNCKRSQYKWAEEHGYPVRYPEAWVKEIAYYQVQHYKPDVLFVAEPLTLDSSF